MSPFCGRADQRLGALRLPGADTLPWRWAHLGPITSDGVRLVEHHAGRACSTCQIIDPGPALRRFEGYQLDLLGLVSPPTTFAASYHNLLRLWYIYAVAWQSADGPTVEWHAERFGPGEFRTREPAGLTDGSAGAIAGRCKDLLLGRFVRRGRPPKTDQAVLDGVRLALLAEDIKAQSPRRKRAEIARDLGTDERTMRRYRAEARRLGLIDDQPLRRLA